MNELIKELQEKGFRTVKHLKIRGKAKAVLDWISLMAYTQPYRIEFTQNGQN